MNLVMVRTHLDTLFAQLGIDGAEPTLERISSGRSGADSYTVGTTDRSFVLRIQPPDRLPRHWEQLVELQRLAADHGLAPRVVHADLERRWLLSEKIEDQSFVAALHVPGRALPLLVQLAEKIADLHGLPLPEGLASRDPVEHAMAMREQVTDRFGLPEFAARAFEHFERQPPRRAGPTVLCHLDLNPTNILYDGHELVLVDWETAGAGDGLIDLATVINMLLLDDALTSAFVGAYAQRRGIAPPSELALREARALAYLGYGITFLELAREPPSEREPSPLPTLAQCYQQLQTGALDLATDRGKWMVGAAQHEAYLRLCGISEAP